MRWFFGSRFTDLGPFRAIKYDKLLALKMEDKTYGWTVEMQLKALKQKGLIKIKNFKKNPNKSNYIYVLTPKGISEKTKLTVNFMKRTMDEYDQLKKELDK